MLFDTLWVKLKLKFSVPSAGLEIPSIFCSTHGPRSMLVVVPALIDCNGHESRTWGRWTLIPTTCKAADSATKTAHAIALRNIRPSTTMKAAHLSQSGMSRRRPFRLIRFLRSRPGSLSRRLSSRRADGHPGGSAQSPSGRYGASQPPGMSATGSSLVSCGSSARNEALRGRSARLVVSIPARKIKKRTICASSLICFPRITHPLPGNPGSGRPGPPRKRREIVSRACLERSVP